MGHRPTHPHRAITIMLVTALLTALPGSPAGATADPVPPRGSILLNSGPLDPRSPDAARRSTRPELPGGKALRIIRFSGPVRPEWLDALRATGVRLVTYVPDDAYLVYGDGESLRRFWTFADGSDEVRWEGAFLPEDKVAAGRDEAVDASRDLFAIQLLWDPPANATTLKWLDGAKLEAPRVQFRILDYLDIVVRLPPSLRGALASFPDVVSVRPYATPEKHDERQDQILATHVAESSPAGPGYLSWLLGLGFTQAQFDASGFAVDLTDSGVDAGTTSPNHFGLYAGGLFGGASRIAYARLVGTPNAGSTTEGTDGHGTLNAHLIAGFNDLSGFPHTDADGYHPGLGVCPFARLGSSVVFDPASWTSPSYPALQSGAYRDGARISSNSWGSVSAGAYTIDSQAYDALVRDAQPATSPDPTPGNQEMVIFFSAGNQGPGAGTVGAPGTAKNVITVGASEGVQPFGGADGCGVDDAAASSYADMAAFSSRGPCADGRHKPDLVAPGTHIAGGVYPQFAGPPSGSGTASFFFDGSGVCGGPVTGPNADLFWPPGQQWTTASSGTSHACPAAVGGAALLRQAFINRGQPPPSPAMTKAYLVGSARWIAGVGAGDSLWSDAQGMGSMDMGRTLDTTPRILRDQVPGDIFTAPGQSATFTGVVSDPTRPFRVTLAWTDAPGSTVGASLMNDLDLQVTTGGQTYLGNAFSGAMSTPGGSPDRKNNLESVLLPPGTSGEFAVTVTAANITSDGVPGVGGSLDQDFALVVYNASPSASPPPVPDGLWVPGTPVTVSKTASDGSTCQIHWDVSSCTAPSYNIYAGPLSAVATGGYQSFSNCGLPGTGSAEISLPPGDVFFVLVAVSGTVEGGHGRDSSGTQRPWTGAGHCGITSEDSTGACP